MRQKKNAGFSTLEMIVTTLILGLSLTVVANGASTVSAIYRRTLAKADAQMIYSQIETNLRAELAFADYVDDVANVTKYYINYINNGETPPVEYELKIDANTSALCVEFDYPPVDGTHYKNFISPTKQDRLESLTVTMPTITYDDAKGCFEVSGLQVEYDGQNMIANTATPQFVIQAANEVKPIPASADP